MSDLLAELDDAMRQERMEKIWHEYKKSIFIGIALAIALTGLISFYRSWDTGVKTEQTAALLALYADEKFPENAAEAASHFRSGHKGLALLKAAGQFVREKKLNQAQELYALASKDSSIPIELRYLATLWHVKLRSEDKANKDQDAATFIADLKPVFETTSGNPWRAHAHLLAATILAQRTGDYTSAIAHLNDVMDTKHLPESLYKKADALRRVYEIRLQKAAG